MVDVAGVCCLLVFWFVFAPAHPIPPTLLWPMLLVSAVCSRLVCYCPSPSHPTTPPVVDIASVCCRLVCYSPSPSHPTTPPMVDVASVCGLLSFGLFLPQPIPSHHPSYGRCCCCLLFACLLICFCRSPSHPTNPPMTDVASVCCLLSFGLLLSQPIPSHHPSYGQCC